MTQLMTGIWLILIGMFSILGPIYNFGNSVHKIHPLITVVVIIITIILISKQYFEYRKNKTIELTNDREIRDYMYNWILTGGSVAIFSHDMTWVADDEIKEMLMAKARKRELCLCLPKHIELSRQLEKQGAEVFEYSQIDYIPKSRFTIVNKGRGDAKVAIGWKKNTIHKIQEFSTGDHPFFYAAEDLVEICSKWSKSANSKK